MPLGKTYFFTPFCAILPLKNIFLPLKNVFCPWWKIMVKKEKVTILPSRYFEIYFLLKFGLNYLRLKICVVLCVQGIFNLKCLLIVFVILNLSQIYFCISQIYKNQFWVQNNHFNLCSYAVNSQRLFCSQKAGVKLWNVCLQAFWNIKIIKMLIIAAILFKVLTSPHYTIF